MVESKIARGAARALAATGSLPPLPPGVSAAELVEAARAQGLSGLLLKAIEADPAPWTEPLVAGLTASRRGTLVRTLGQIGLAVRALELLAARGIRALPLKGVVLAETVYGVESDRPMSDVDVLALERFEDGVAAFREAGFVEIDRGDHAWAFRDPSGGELAELHRSVTSCPGLFPLAADAVWERSRPGRGQLPRLPSAEDLLVQLALHAAFQHGLVLSLVQWLDFRRVLEGERVDPDRLLAVAAEAHAEAPLAASLVVAHTVIGAPVPDAVREALARHLPAGLRRWLEPRLAAPLAFVLPATPDHVRVRWELVSGPRRRAELVWRTLVLPEDPDRAPSGSRVARAARRAWRFAALALRKPRPEAPPAATTQAPDGAAGGQGRPLAGSHELATTPEVPFREELLRECLGSFPWVRLTVTGQCMQPALADGERVHLVHAARRRPRLGDVVLARGREGLRLHRLVWGPPLSLGRRRWRTRADRGLLLDPPLDPRDVLATVVAVEERPDARPRRPGAALVSLARGVLARLRLGGRATGAEVVP